MRLLAAALLAIVVASVPLASAHADLQSADPAPNAHVPVGVTELTLTFTEDVERTYTNVDCVDVINQTSVAAGPLQFDPAQGNVVHLPVKPLGDGIYSVSWRTLSSDTHTLRGGYLFSVGNATLAQASPPTSVSSTADLGSTLKEGFARTLFYLGAFVAVGVPVFAIVVDRRSLGSTPLAGTSAVLALVGAGGALASFLFLAQRTEQSLAQSLADPTGAFTAARAGLLAVAGLALLAAAALPRARAALGGVSIAFGGLAIVATSMSSHAAADLQLRDVSIAVDALHLAMAALWVGGVLAFAFAVRGRTSPEVGAMVARFTPLALASVALILASGTYASLRHIPTLPDLWSTTYGQLVLAKIALLGVLVLFGAFNQKVMGPRLRDARATPGQMRRSLQLEAATMACVLLVAGVLASQSPPTLGVQPGPASEYAAPYFELTASTSLSHVIFQIQPNPPAIGISTLDVTVHSLAPTTTLPNGTTIALKFAEPGQREPSNLVAPNETTPGVWEMQGALFTKPGNWTVYVLLQRPDEYHKFNFTVPVVVPTKA
jgi:copper transport protein